jgi:hypothetical protein
MATASRKSERRAEQRLNAAALIARGMDHRAKRLIACVLQDEKREETGYRTWKCQQRHCLFCGWRHWKRLRFKYSRRIERLMRADYRLSLLTLTIPNVLSLNPGIYRFLSINLKKLLRKYLLQGRVIGAVARIETDFNSDSQDFHVHIHAILIYRRCIPQEEIAEAWRNLMSLMLIDYVPSDIPGRESSSCFVWIEKVEPEEIRETVRYLFKFDPIKGAEAFAEYDCAVRNVRLVQAYGALRGRIKKP